MIIHLKKPLKINLSQLAAYIPNSGSSVNLIYERKTIKDILSCSEEIKGEGYTKIETELTIEELGEILKTIPSSLTKELILALGRAEIHLPGLYQIAVKEND